jgi:predicted transcriptional regulator
VNKVTPLTVQLDPAISVRLATVAEALDKPESWVVEQAVKDFVAVQEWQLAAIQDGIAQADAGRLIPHEEVVAWVRSWGSPDELPMPECD